jgi:site-specific DNA-cytosine methylase
MIAMNSTQDLSVFLVTHDPYYGEFLTYLTDNNAPTKYIDKVKRARAKIDAGKNFYSFGPLVLNDDFVPAIIFKTTAAMVHPIHNRSFTYREIMTLQGYPKKLDWPEELLKDFPQMIGQNAAPIQTCDWIFRNCLRIIEMNEHVRMRESPGELIVDNTKVPKTQGFHFGSS